MNDKKEAREKVISEVSVIEKTRSRSKNKKKVKAWCADCFQSFENGPFSKVCKDHLKKGQCNIIECKKQFLSETPNPCIRRFPNTNSENRHTYCIRDDEIKSWEKSCNIQVCLGHKRHADTSFQKNSKNQLELVKNEHLDEGEGNSFIHSINEEELNRQIDNLSKRNNYEQSFISVNKPELTLEKSISIDFNLDTISNSNTQLFGNLIDRIDSLNFFEKDKFNSLLDDNIINDFGKIYFTPKKSDIIDIEKSLFLNKSDEKISNSNNLQSEIEEQTPIKTLQSQIDEQTHTPLMSALKTPEKKEEKITKPRGRSKEKNSIIRKRSFQSKSKDKFQSPIKLKEAKEASLKETEEEVKEPKKYKLSDDENIDSIFEKVYLNTGGIPKTVINKLKSAFKKKGILNAKVLRLFRAKHESWSFLFEEFKKVCTQIEGITLYLESLLEE
jgi:hypothetical protein